MTSEIRRRGVMRDHHCRILARLTASGMHPDMVISKDELAALSGLHTRSIDRLLAARDGPPRVALSPGRIGFILRDSQAWIAARRNVSNRFQFRNAGERVETVPSDRDVPAGGRT